MRWPAAGHIHPFCYPVMSSMNVNVLFDIPKVQQVDLLS